MATTGGPIADGTSPQDTGEAYQPKPINCPPSTDFLPMGQFANRIMMSVTRVTAMLFIQHLNRPSRRTRSGEIGFGLF
jgi:hypothetical protein